MRAQAITPVSLNKKTVIELISKIIMALRVLFCPFKIFAITTGDFSHDTIRVIIDISKIILQLELYKVLPSIESLVAIIPVSISGPPINRLFIAFPA
jgi:hypothetical protein